jgi:hypothetical protein
MKSIVLEEIKLNQFQLNVLLSEEDKEEYEYIIEEEIFCMKCDENCSQGVEIKEHFLNTMNDLLLKGTCKKCGTAFSHFIDFGEDPDFFKRAVAFRKSIGKE